MKNNSKKILITGSSGTIGTRLFETLLEQGHDVIGFDKKKNEWHPHLNKITIIGNLLNKKDLKKIPKNIDMVIHLAANARVYDLVQDPELALDNIVSTYNILDYMRIHTIKKILFSSSREVYANRKKSIAKESEVNIELCESPYAASKISDELLVYSFSKCYGINYIICRFSNVYGMYDQSNRFVPLLMRKMQKNENIEIFGKDKVLDFTYIDDCVAGIMACIKKFPKVKNTVFNIASGKGTNLVDVAKIIKKNLGSKSNILIGKNRTGEVVKYIADISKASKIGYKPIYSINEGLDLSIGWYQKHGNNH